MQYYFLAPFLLQFIAANYFSPLLVTLIILFLSLLLQLCIQNEEVAFELLFCRIWQFLIGTAAYYFSINNINEKFLNIFNNENMRQKQRYLQSGLFCILFLICFNFLSFDDKNLKVLLRLITTLIAGILITMEDNYVFDSGFLGFRVLLFIGEISYTIYMVHWPAIIFFRYFDITHYGKFILFGVQEKSNFNHPIRVGALR